ncbi:Lytic murein transglycosylase [Candidatus Magnetomoraceae bacterium gMMP-15]
MLKLSATVLIYALIIFLLVPCNITLGSSLKYKLLMLGYNDKEINDIMLGRKTRRQIDMEHKRKMLGLESVTPSYDNTFINTFTNSANNNTIKKKTYKTSVNKSLPDTFLAKSSSHAPFYNRSPFGNSGEPFSKKGIKGIFKDAAYKQSALNVKGFGKKNKLTAPAEQYLSIIEKAALKNDVKKSLILAVIHVESSFNHTAVSPKGAMGLMQLMPGTAILLGVKNAFDPSQNINGGTKYLSQCLKTFNDIKLAVAAYNAGPALVEKLQRIPRIRETQNFVRNVLRYEKIYDNLIKKL